MLVGAALEATARLFFGAAGTFLFVVFLLLIFIAELFGILRSLSGFTPPGSSALLALLFLDLKLLVAAVAFESEVQSLIPVGYCKEGDGDTVLY